MQGYIRIWPMFAKDQCSYTIRFLRQEKSLRDHSCLDAPGHPHKTGNALNRAPSGWEEGSSAWAAGPSARAPGLALMADARRSVAGRSARRADAGRIPASRPPAPRLARRSARPSPENLPGGTGWRARNPARNPGQGSLARGMVTEGKCRFSGGWVAVSRLPATMKILPGCGEPECWSLRITM